MMLEMTNTYIYLLLGVIFSIGFITNLREFLQYKKRDDFAYEYFNNLKKYIESGGNDNISFTWLTSKSSKIQNQMGTFGIVGYKPPGANYIHNNYQLIVNGLSELRQNYSERYIMDRLANEMAATLQEALIRYIGHLEDKVEASKSNLFNPIIAFREGVRLILAIPFKLLGWFGIVSMSIIYSFTTSTIFKIFSGIAAIVALLGTVMSLVLGWSDFVKIITGG